MKKFLFVLLGLLIVLGIVWATLGTGTLSNIFMNKQRFESLVERFESPDRLEWQKPDEVVALLGDINGKTIMDIGGGTGYFSFRLSARGANVIAADVDERFSNYVLNKKEKLRDSLVVTRMVEYDDPLLKPAEVDHVLVVNTYHHINKREDYFAKVAKGIKPGGSLMVVDFKKDAEGFGPPKRYRVSTQKVQEELTAAGFSNFKVNDTLLENFYVVIAEK